MCGAIVVEGGGRTIALRAPVCGASWSSRRRCNHCRHAGGAQGSVWVMRRLSRGRRRARTSGEGEERRLVMGLSFAVGSPGFGVAATQHACMEGDARSAELRQAQILRPCAAALAAGTRVRRCIVSWTKRAAGWRTRQSRRLTRRRSRSFRVGQETLTVQQQCWALLGWRKEFQLEPRRPVSGSGCRHQVHRLGAALQAAALSVQGCG